ncbi:MAG: hypothetical protein AB7V32_06285 [Candidatus Berkiella sp.]
MNSFVSTILSAILAFMLWAPQFAFAISDQYSLETFYKDETYSHFVNAISSAHSFHSSCDPTNSKMIVFATYVFKKHPDFATQVVVDFAAFDTCQQQVVCSSLMNARFYGELNAINEKHQNACTINDSISSDNLNMQLLSNIESYEDENKQSIYMDNCWAAFFATGDESHISKMVEYAKLHQDREEHARIISDFIAKASSLAQQDPLLNDILDKHTQGCLSCFR